MTDHSPAAEAGATDTQPLAPVVATVAGLAVVSLIVACVGSGVVGDAWYAGTEALFRAGFLIGLGLLVERFGIGWTRAADASRPMASATIETPARTAGRVVALLALLVAGLAALSLLFDGAESFFQMLGSAAGIFGWGTVASKGWERRTGRTLLSVRGSWFRRLQLVSAPTAAVRRAGSATAAG